MNAWNALDVYDLVNDGHGNYRFNRTYKPGAGRFNFLEFLSCAKLAWGFHKEAKRESKVGLTTYP